MKNLINKILGATFMFRYKMKWLTKDEWLMMRTEYYGTHYYEEEDDKWYPLPMCECNRSQIDNNLGECQACHFGI